MKGYNFKKCDPCRKSEKGCSGDEPCVRCVERGMPDGCESEIGKEKLAAAIAEENKNKDKAKVVDGEKSKDSVKGKDKETAVERQVANEFCQCSICQ